MYTIKQAAAARGIDRPRPPGVGASLRDRRPGTHGEWLPALRRRRDRARAVHAPPRRFGDVSECRCRRDRLGGGPDRRRRAFTRADSDRAPSRSRSGSSPPPRRSTRSRSRSSSTRCSPPASFEWVADERSCRPSRRSATRGPTAASTSPPNTPRATPSCAGLPPPTRRPDDRRTRRARSSSGFRRERGMSSGRSPSRSRRAELDCRSSISVRISRSPTGSQRPAECARGRRHRRGHRRRPRAGRACGGRAVGRTTRSPGRLRRAQRAR